MGLAGWGGFLGRVSSSPLLTKNSEAGECECVTQLLGSTELCRWCQPHRLPTAWVPEEDPAGTWPRPVLV